MKTIKMKLPVGRYSAIRYFTLFFALLVCGRIGAQQSYTFVSAGATGANGPSQGQINTAYALTNLNGLVVVTGGIQSWTVPATGMYRISASGAQGGSITSSPFTTGGLGSRMEGDFNLTAGSVLQIVVGQRGVGAIGTAGGGGGSYVVENNLPLAVGGGGGGASNANNGVNSVTVTSGTQDFPASSLGGTNGSGGGACTGGAGAMYNAGGGGGFLAGATGNGVSNANATGGLSFLNGSTGGSGSCVGGFGGGGGAYQTTVGGGGGGGYSGGAGGQLGFSPCMSGPQSGGGGGGSFNSGANQMNSPGVNSGNGQVVITSLCDVEVTGVTTICEGASTTLSTSAQSNILWSTGSTAQSIIVSPQTTTQYTVSGNGTGCSSVIVFSVVVNPLPTVSAMVSPALLCVGSTATLTGTGANTYTWSTGPTTTITTVNPVVTTTYNVFGTSAAGCLNSSVVTVNVNTLALSVTGNTIVCLGKSTSLTGSGGTNLSWVNFGPFATINPVPTALTNYTLTGIDANNCPLSKVVSVDINQNPSVTANAINTLVCKNQPVTLTAGGASSYTWNTSATTSSITVTPLLEVPHSYTVTGTDANGCEGSAFITINVSNCVGIFEQNNNVVLTRIYPNPTKGNVTLEFGDALPKTIEVMDVSGRRMILKTTNLQSSEIDMSGFAPGVYSIKVSVGNSVSVNKIVKE